MSPNRERPHLLVLPEDKADADIANGFILHLQQRENHSIQVLPYVGGWKVVVEKFKEEHIPKMQKYPERRIVLLIDFDNKENRLEYVNQQIPEVLRDRVFVLGVFSNPEALKKDLKQNLESIGETLAANCADNTDELWQHELLKHNKAELIRMTSTVKPFLFN